MFKIIIGLGHITLNGVKYYKFEIRDTCFIETVQVRSGYGDSFELALQFIKTYKRKNLNVLPNLVTYYTQLYNNGVKIRELITGIHPKYIDAADKSIRFKEHYMPLLKMRMPYLFPIPKLMKTYSLEEFAKHNIIVDSNVH